jgi:hypothetical protein
MQLFEKSRIGFERGNKLVRFEVIGTAELSWMNPQGPQLTVAWICIDAKGQGILVPFDKLEVPPSLWETKES